MNAIFPMLWLWLTGMALVTLYIVFDPWIRRNSKPKPPTTRKWRSRAYLVVHLDLRVSPPVAVFAQIYSCKAKDLTMTGAREARADLYMVEADTFQEAHNEMRRVVPLYFPWAVPLMVRSQ